MYFSAIFYTRRKSGEHLDITTTIEQDTEFTIVNGVRSGPDHELRPNLLT